MLRLLLLLRSLIVRIDIDVTQLILIITTDYIVLFKYERRVNSRLQFFVLQNAMGQKITTPSRRQAARSCKDKHREFRSSNFSEAIHQTHDQG